MIELIGWILYLLVCYGLGYLLGLSLDLFLRPILEGVLA